MEKEKKRFRIPRVVIKWVTAVFAILMLLSAWCSLISPAYFWPLAMLGLIFPFLFVINLCFLIFWIFTKRRFMLVPIIAVVLGGIKLPAVFQPHNSSDVPQGKEAGFKVISFNVRLFDLYNWSHNLQTRAKIFEFLEKEQPDVLCLQEFYSSEDKDFNNLKMLSEILKAHNYQVEYPITLRNKDHWGIATFTRFPIVNKSVLYFDKQTANVCIYTDVKVDNDTIRIYNCHLQSIRFKAEDYQFFEDLGQGQTELNRMQRTRKIISRMRLAYIKRARQADLMAENIAISPYPTMVCGDFNDTPVSYTYNTISGNLKDAFIESGSGLGSTYAGPLPGLRIDYLLHSKSLQSFGFSTFNVRLSDHFPITGHIRIKPQ